MHFDAGTCGSFMSVFEILWLRCQLLSLSWGYLVEAEFCLGLLRLESPCPKIHLVTSAEVDMSVLPEDSACMIPIFCTRSSRVICKRCNAPGLNCSPCILCRASLEIAIHQFHQCRADDLRAVCAVGRVFESFVLFHLNRRHCFTVEVLPKSRIGREVLGARDMQLMEISRRTYSWYGHPKDSPFR